MPTQADLELADLEFRLHIAQRSVFAGDQVCSEYLARNRKRLVPQIVEAAERDGVEPDVQVARFVVGVHQRHLERGSL